MPVILETISWILKNVNVGVDRLIVGYGVRFVYSESPHLLGLKDFSFWVVWAARKVMTISAIFY